MNLGIHAFKILDKHSMADGSTEGPFPLKHPDLSFQNILVDNEFRVVAVLDWSLSRTVPAHEFGHFHTPTTLRLPFIVQENDEQVGLDREYFLTCLEEERERNCSLDLKSIFQSEYMEIASLVTALEVGRPEATFVPRLAQLLRKS